MLLSISFKNALKLIGNGKEILHENIIPKEFPLNPNSTYRTGYHWLYRYERDLIGHLSPWLEHFRYELIGEKGLLAEALSNAFYHGHRKDPKLCIEVTIYVGLKGILVKIHDCGAGFDVKKIYNHYLKGKPYFHTAGNGIRSMANSKLFGIFYNNLGNTFHLLYLFEQNWPANIQNIR
ncbi:MAG: ATP-binding protein [Desulfobacteraceae bacterium]|jgi:hypothetical protein